MLEASDVQEKIVVTSSIASSILSGDSSPTLMPRTRERAVDSGKGDETKRLRKLPRKMDDRKERGREKPVKERELKARGNLSPEGREKNTDRERDKISLDPYIGGSGSSEDAADGLPEAGQRGEDPPKPTRSGEKDKPKIAKAGRMQRFASSGRLTQLFRGTSKLEPSTSPVEGAGESKSVNGLSLRMEGLSLSKTPSSQISPRLRDGNNRSPRGTGPKVLPLHKGQGSPRERMAEDRDKIEIKRVHIDSNKGHDMPSPRGRKAEPTQKILVPKVESESSSSDESSTGGLESKSSGSANQGLMSLRDITISLDSESFPPKDVRKGVSSFASSDPRPSSRSGGGNLSPRSELSLPLSIEDSPSGRKRAPSLGTKDLASGSNMRDRGARERRKVSPSRRGARPSPIIYLDIYSQVREDEKKERREERPGETEVGAEGDEQGGRGEKDGGIKETSKASRSVQTSDLKSNLVASSPRDTASVPSLSFHDSSPRRSSEQPTQVHGQEGGRNAQNHSHGSSDPSNWGHF